MKAILEIIMPATCKACPCYYWEFLSCNAENREIDDDTIEQVGRPPWCPLKEEG